MRIYAGDNGTCDADNPKYCKAGGRCVGPGGSGDYVNAKLFYGTSGEQVCRDECDASPACVGYSYGYSGRSGRCYVHGPGLDTDLAGNWFAYTSPTTTIAGADYGYGYHYVCAAVAGRN